MTDRAPDNFRPLPVQEEGEQSWDQAATQLLTVLLKNPEVITYLQTLGREPAKRSRLRRIPTALVEVTCGSFSRIWFFLVLLWRVFKSVFNVKREIQAEKLTEFDNMKKKQEEVNTKQRKVHHEAEKMEDKIKIAQESHYRIGRKDDNELETGLINSTCDLDACQDLLNDLKAEFSDLLHGAKEAVAIKQKAVITVLVFATAFTAGFFVVTYQCRVATSVGLVIVMVQLLICRWKAQVYFSNQMLLTKCEEFRKNELQTAQELQKQLKRDVEKRLPALKNQLAVLDIDVSLYASLRPHSE